MRLRRGDSKPGEIARPLADGNLIKTWAMRGALHLLTPAEAGNFLSLLAAGRSWERSGWQKWFGVGPQEIQQLRIATREVLDGCALTREELAAAVTRRPGLAHVGAALRSSWGTLLGCILWWCESVNNRNLAAGGHACGRDNRFPVHPGFHAGWRMRHIHKPGAMSRIS